MDKQYGIVTRILAVPLKYIILVFLVVKRALVDYITRPKDMKKSEFLSFHSGVFVYSMLTVIMVFVDPSYLLLLFISLVIIGHFTK